MLDLGLEIFPDDPVANRAHSNMRGVARRLPVPQLEVKDICISSKSTDEQTPKGRHSSINEEENRRMTVFLPPLRYPNHPQKPQRGTETSAALVSDRRILFFRFTAASAVREKSGGRFRAGVWAVISKSSKGTQPAGHHPVPPPLDIPSEISTLPQEKWAPQGEISFHHRCWRLL